jgi:hypothetical protein
MAAGGGFVLTVLYIIFGGAGLAWCAFGLAVAGAVSLVAGAAELIDDRRTLVVVPGPSDDTVAMLCGVAIPLVAVVAPVAFAVAVGAS